MKAEEQNLSGGTHYRIREKAFSIGDDFWIETASGERAFKIDGKGLRHNGTFRLEGPAGEELYAIQASKPGARDAMEITHGDDCVATVTKRAGIHDHYSIEVEGGEDFAATGTVLDRKFEFERDGETIASVSNDVFGVRHTLGVAISPGEDDTLILAAIVCIDWMGRG